MAVVFIEIEPAKLKWRVFHEGEVLIERTSDPIHDAARELWAGGADVDDTLMMYHKGNPMMCMSGKVGAIASHRMLGLQRAAWPPESKAAKESDDED